MALATGTRIGPYEIIAPLGAGGMGEVYRARDSRLKREVALKVLPERMRSDGLALERFRREAQLLAGMNHPHIAAVYGFEDGALAMELVEGETLAERLRRGAMPMEEALTMARQLAGALEYAHERGIIHRDLKPANIKLTPEDKVKVLDFGLAKALSPELSGAELEDAPTLTTPATLAGTILGTAAYMAPEQARGKAVDRRADIWAFGAVWYEMLTGARAFAGETTSDVLAGVIRADPDWARLPDGLPERHRRLLVRCLQKDPYRRQQSIGDVRLELEEPVEAATPAAAAAAARKGWGAWASGTVAAILGAILIAILGMWWWMPRPAAAGHTAYRAITSLAGVQMQPTLSPDGSSIAFLSDQDGHENLYITLIGGGTMLQVTHSAEEKSRPVWSPNGHVLVYGQRNVSGLWDLWEVPVLGGTPRRLLRDATDATWSPDGQWLAYVRSSTGGLWISTPQGENAELLARAQLVRDGDPKFSPDGTRIAFVDSSSGPYGQIEMVDRGSKKVVTLTNDYSIALSPTWSPEGRWIYFAWGASGAINVWKIPAGGGGAVQVTTGQGDDAQLDLSADGKRLVFATFRTDSHIAQMNANALAGRGAVTMLTTDPARNQLAPQYSPDGTRLAYFTNLKGVETEQLWTARADGSQAQPLVNDRMSNIFPRWSADGLRVYFNSDTPRTRNSRQSRSVASDGGAPQIMLAEQNDLYFDVGAGGKMLMVSAGGIASYDPATRTRQVVWPGQAGLVPYMARWAPGGGGIGFSVKATGDGDGNAGVWTCTVPCSEPRQIFKGWVRDFERGPRGTFYLRAGSPDLHDALWTVGWDGRGLTKLGATLPMPHDYWGAGGRDLFAVSPDGQHIAYTLDDDLQSTIGMLTFGK